MFRLKHLVLLPLLSSFVVQQKCDLAQLAKATPEQVQQTTIQGVQPYFPNAVVKAVPEQHLLLALTCTKNIGHEMVLEIAQKLPLVKDVQKLKMLRQVGGVLGFQTYSRFAIGFEHEVVVLEVDRNLEPGLLNIPNQQAYEQEYSSLCGFSDATPAATADASYIWVGVFKVTGRKGNQPVSFTTSDTLGIYTEADFENFRAEELSSRKTIARGFLQSHGVEVESLELVRIVKSPLSESLTAQLR